MYEKTLVAGWGDMDFNSQMSNTAYLVKAADVRMIYFAECGFPMSEFMRLKVGPVVLKDEVEYFREFHLLDEVNVSLTLAGLSSDGSRMKMRNDFFKGGKLAARITSTAGWLDLNARRLLCPPPALLSVLQALAHSEDFEILSDSSR
jgi:acyl-CoA thioester hydrolase